MTVSEPRSQRKFTATIYLCGPFRLATSDGSDVTPAGQVRKGILAVLCASPRGLCARTRLIEMFWGGSSESKGAGSLRTALSTLRAELRYLGLDFLQADRQTISIDLDRVTLDCNPSGGEFLEGIDLRIPGSEGFEEWLRTERSRRAPELLPDVDVLDLPSQSGLGVVFVSEARSAETAKANALLDKILRHAIDWIECPIFDYRGRDDKYLPSGAGPVVVLQAEACAPTVRPGLRLRLLRASDERLLWSDTFEWPTTTKESPNDTVHHDDCLLFIVQSAEKIVRAIENADRKVGSTLHAFCTMFDLGGNALIKTEELLKSNWDAFGRSEAQALLSYSDTLRKGEVWTDRRIMGSGRIMPLLRGAISDPDISGVSRAAIAYSAHYLEQQTDLALDLLQTAVKVSPSQAFCWDHLALALYHTGHIREAREASDRAIALSRLSPLRYAYEATRMMIAFAERDYITAARYGQRTLARQPLFSAALRYSSASLANLGQIEKAMKLNQQIRAQAPDFNTEAVEAGEFRIANRETANALASGLRLGGLE